MAQGDVVIYVKIDYTDGSSQMADVSCWSSLRSDGVFRVTVGSPERKTEIAWSSIYWLYFEDGNVVVGWGSVRYDPNPLTEIVITPDGTQSERRIEFMPDVEHSEVKLGWWDPNFSAN